MKFSPLIPMRATTITKAFILNSIVLAITAAFSTELRNLLDQMEQTKQLTETKKFMITIGGTFIIGLLIYFVCRIFFGLGEGMLATRIEHKLF